MARKVSGISGLIILILAGLTACTTEVPITPAPSPTATVSYTQYQIEYLLFNQYLDYFWCDPDLYPVARPGGEEAKALQQFPDIQANTAEFSAILENLNLTPKSSYTDEDKLTIYREHKKLTYALSMTSTGNGFNFTLRTGQNQGQRITGMVTKSGEISVAGTETSFNTCPICLTRGTRIDTPDGEIPVEQFPAGKLVWTVDSSGKRQAAPIIKTVTTPVPPAFEVVRITLSDGRLVTASPGHPTAEMRALGDYRVGEILDSSRVMAADRIVYQYGLTFDILPAGGTALYWANGILLKSTLSAD